MSFSSPTTDLPKSGATQSGTGPTASALTYEPSLDGLRAVAVLAVMGYHFTLPGITGGFLGVDVFFVLSGYLITSILLREHQRQGAINYVAFWGRRARRLFPALSVMLLGVCIYAVFSPALEQVTIRGQGIATLFYVNNWWIILSGQSYFDQFQAPSPLIHTWSLGVEEQWYLLFPVLLAGLLLWRLRADGRLVAALGTLAVASTLWTGFLANGGASADRLYLGTDTRAQELLVGATLAAWAQWRRVQGQTVLPGWARHSGAWGLALLGAVVLAFFLVSETDRGLFYGGMLAFSLVVAGLIAVCSTPGSNLTNKTLSWEPLRKIGLISYGLYLWHWPLLVILTPARVGVDGLLLFAVRMVLTFILAIASYVFVEMPIRRGALKRKFGSQGQIGIAFASVAILLVAVMGSTAMGAREAANNPELLNNKTKDITYTGIGPRVFIIGDSVPYGLRENFPQQGMQFAVGGATELGCGQFPTTYVLAGSDEESDPKCYQWVDRRGELLDAANADLAVLFLGHYQQYDIRINGQVVRQGTPEYEAWLTAQIERAIADLRRGGKKVALVNVPCHRTVETATNPKSIAMNDDTRVAWLNGVIAKVAAQDGNVPVVDLDAWECGAGKDPENIDGVAMRVDGLHYTPEGADLVWSFLQSQFLQIIGSEPVPATTPAPDSAGKAKDRAKAKKKTKAAAAS